MHEHSPFRERPKFLLCPRCGEMLDRAFDAVLVCLRCEGVWIAPISLEKAFGNPKWPQAAGMWWHNSLECPECAFEGKATTMDAGAAGGVIIDRCHTHGLWLDRGELGRLMGGDTDDERGDDDLVALRDKLAGAEIDLEQLLKRRDAWRADVDVRRTAAAEYRKWLETEERRRIETAQALARADRERAEAEQTEAIERALRERDRDRALQKLGDARVAASAEVARLESSIIMTREQLHQSEAELVGARARLRAIDDQLEAIDRDLPGRVI